MPNQFKTRIQCLDATTKLRHWVEMEVYENGINLTILKPTGERNGSQVFEVVTKVYAIRDQFVGFIVGYLVSGIGAYDKTIQDLIYKIAKQIVEAYETKEEKNKHIQSPDLAAH